MITKDSIFCLVIDGIISKYNVSQRDTGLGVNSPLELYISKGWFPLEDNKPTIDIETQRYGGNSYEIQADKVVKNYSVVDIPIEELMAKKIAQGEAYVEGVIQTVLDNFNKKYGRKFESINGMASYSTDQNYSLHTQCDTLIKWKNLFWDTSRANQDAVVAGIMTDEEFIAALPTPPEV